MVRPCLSNPLPSLGSCRKINNNISIYQPARGSQPSQNSQRDECATSMLQVGMSPPGAGGSTPRSSLYSAALIQPSTTSFQWGWPHGPLCWRLLHGETPKLTVPPLPGRATAAPHCQLGHWPSPMLHHRAVLSLSAPPFSLPPHIHSYSYPFPGFTGDVMRDKSSRSYLTSNLGTQHPYPPAGSDQHTEITTQTLPNFYSAQPRGVPPVSSGAGGQL